MGLRLCNDVVAEVGLRFPYSLAKARFPFAFPVVTCFGIQLRVREELGECWLTHTAQREGQFLYTLHEIKNSPSVLFCFMLVSDLKNILRKHAWMQY